MVDGGWEKRLNCKEAFNYETCENRENKKLGMKDFG